MKHYEFEISQFTDGELPPEEETEMFSHLQECSNCRMVFRDYMELKRKNSAFFSGLAADLPVIKLPENKQKTIPLYYAAVASIVLFGLLTYTYLNFISAHGEAVRLHALFAARKTEMPDKKIVEYRTVEKIKYIKQKPEIISLHAEKQAGIPAEKCDGCLKEIENLKSVVITENDMILSKN
jgi:hypothetical protein